MREEKPKSGDTRRIVLTGGGTGGHVYPALAIAEAIRERDPDARFVYVGVPHGAESEIVPKYPDLVRPGDLHFVDVVGMPDRTLSFGTVRFVLRLAFGTLRACRLLKRIRPVAVVGTGGYASAPTVLAARLRGLPILLNEQNAVPGKVTRLLGRVASVVVLAFEKTLEWFPKNGVHAGYPVRAAVREAATRNRADQRAALGDELGIDPSKALVLVTGGSLGARSINRAMVQAVCAIAGDPALRKRIAIVHGVGRCETADYHAWDDTTERLETAGIALADVRDFYRPVRYLFDIERYYAAADVVCCRGGAGSVAEAAAFGRRTLVIPKSGLPGDHQVENALALAERGACRVLRETRDRDGVWTIDSGEFLRELTLTIDLPDAEAAEMGRSLAALDRPDCARRIVDAFERVLAAR